MTKRWVPFVFVAVGVLVAACGGHVDSHQALLRTAPPFERPAFVYVEGQMPPGEFYELGLVQTIGFGSDADAEELVRVLAHDAAEAGCQAVVRVAIDMGTTRAHASGVCVRFVGAPPQSAVRVPASAAIRPQERVPRSAESAPQTNP